MLTNSGIYALLIRTGPLNCGKDKKKNCCAKYEGKSCRIVPQITRILQNFWLTKVNKLLLSFTSRKELNDFILLPGSWMNWSEEQYPIYIKCNQMILKVRYNRFPGGQTKSHWKSHRKKLWKKSYNTGLEKSHHWFLTRKKLPELFMYMTFYFF